MSGFKIKRRFAHHEGGTKAYQIHEITNGATSVVVFQFGKFRTGDDPVSMGGTIDIHGAFGAAGAMREADNKESVKTRRGYKEWEVDTAVFATKAELREVLVKMFGAHKADTILQSLEAGAVPAVSEEPPTPGVENSVKGKAKAPAPKTEESLPEWGTW